jgi:ABC-type branched-subunit amino acid transport system ATPase component
MKLTFTALGVLDHVEIELGNLTIVCGKNNTGKTYATYATYGFLRNWRQFSTLFLLEKDLRKLTSEGSLEIDLQEYPVKQWDKILNIIAGSYKELLPNVLASAEAGRFANTSVHMDIPAPSVISKTDFEHLERMTGDKQLATFSKKADSSILTITLFPGWKSQIPEFALHEIIGSVIQTKVLVMNYSQVFMASTERTGAAIFKNELNFTRTRLIEAMTQTKSAQLKPQDILEALMPFNSKYALPVRDEVDFANQLESIQKEESELLQKHPDILDDFNDLLGGEYKVVKGVVYFAPESAKSTRLGLNETSSAVRSLLDIGFYLRHRARINDIFMMDEPELNLHPANQRKIARLIARLVNAGLRIFITNHSDYIAKELNTLFLLHKAGSDFAQTLGYKPDELIDDKHVRLYIAGETKKRLGADAQRATKCQTLLAIPQEPDGGFEFGSFDDTILEINKTQSQVWDHIMEQSKEA